MNWNIKIILYYWYSLGIVSFNSHEKKSIGFSLQRKKDPISTNIPN